MRVTAVHHREKTTPSASGVGRVNFVGDRRRVSGVGAGATDRTDFHRHHDGYQAGNELARRPPEPALNN